MTLTSSLASKVFAFDSQTSHCCFPLEDIVGLILLSTLRRLLLLLLVVGRLVVAAKISSQN